MTAEGLKGTPHEVVKRAISKRYDYVDLLRGLAALAVLICHYQWFYSTLGTRPVHADLPLSKYLWPFYLHGGLAVQVFWVLSGFVFAVAYHPGISVRTFLIHRVARLYPLHLITLCAVAIMQAVSWQTFGAFQVYKNNDLEHFLLQLAFASNWFTMDHSFNAPIWSVSIEVLIYFVFLAYLKSSKFYTAVALSIFGLTVQLFSHNYVGQCASLFFAGVAISYFPVDRRWIIPAILTSATACALVPFAGDRALIYIFAPSILVLCIALDRTLSFPRPLLWIGAITYSIYLLHMPVLIFSRILLGTSYVPFLPSPWTLFAFVGTVVILSLFSYRWIEIPAQRVIRSFARNSAKVP